MTRSDLVATMLNRCSPAIKDHTRLRTMGRKRLKGDPGHERQAEERPGGPVPTEAQVVAMEKARTEKGRPWQV